MSKKEQQPKYIETPCPECGRIKKVLKVSLASCEGRRCSSCAAKRNHILHPEIRKTAGKKSQGETHQFISAGYRLIRLEEDDQFVEMAWWSKRLKAYYVSEHRYRMAYELDRCLTSKELVHHLDGDKLNNSPENLMITPPGKHKKSYHSGYQAGYVQGYEDGDQMVLARWTRKDLEDKEFCRREYERD